MNIESSVSTSIIPTDKIETLLAVSNKKSLILSDITNTLYKPCNTLSDKNWRTYFAKKVRETITDPAIATKIANTVENIIVNKIDKKPVYDKAPAVIKELQKQEIPILAITMKSWSAPYDPFFGITTSNHLEKLGIHLENSVPFVATKEQGSDIQEYPEYTFAKGIIFTNKNLLNKSLDAFLNRLEKKPEQIVIFENSESQKEKLESVIKAHGIALTYVRHSFVDNCEPIDPILGNIEFLEFMEGSHVIFDDEALSIKNNNAQIDYENLLKEYIKNNSIKLQG